MSNFRGDSDRLQEEHLADFTDRILSDRDEQEWAEVAVNDIELAELEQTVVRMKHAVDAAQPDAATSQRIRAHLLAEWKKPRAAPTFSWFRGRLALAGGLALGIVLVGAGLLFNSSGVPLTGTAIGSVDGSPFFIVLGLILIIFLLWIERRK
jgi:hypothetical protein